jgi:hypothetical protein
MNLHRAPRAALIRSHGFHEQMLEWCGTGMILTKGTDETRGDAFALLTWRLPYAEGRMAKTEKRRAQWRRYNHSLSGWFREMERNRTGTRAAYMRARGRERTATIRAERGPDGLAYQGTNGRWRVM